MDYLRAHRRTSFLAARSTGMTRFTNSVVELGSSWEDFASWIAGRGTHQEDPFTHVFCCLNLPKGLTRSTPKKRLSHEESKTYWAAAGSILIINPQKHSHVSCYADSNLGFFSAEETIQAKIQIPVLAKHGLHQQLREGTNGSK